MRDLEITIPKTVPIKYNSSLIIVSHMTWYFDITVFKGFRWKKQSHNLGPAHPVSKWPTLR